MANKTNNADNPHFKTSRDHFFNDLQHKLEVCQDMLLREWI